MIFKSKVNHKTLAETEELGRNDAYTSKALKLVEGYPLEVFFLFAGFQFLLARMLIAFNIEEERYCTRSSKFLIPMQIKPHFQLAVLLFYLASKIHSCISHQKFLIVESNCS